uniref:Histone acetyltransferase n=1 Tax=Parascaris equorum TaxID=6256 RepID=A0A914RT32_PAREQ
MYFLMAKRRTVKNPIEAKRLGRGEIRFRRYWSRSLLEFPHETAAVVGGNVLTSQRICDVIFLAFNAVAASQGLEAETELVIDS